MHLLDEVLHGLGGISGCWFCAGSSKSWRSRKPPKARAEAVGTAQQLWACNQAHDGSRAFDAASAPLELPPAGTCADAADAEAHCGAWAGAGECARNAAFMRLKCRRSCGMCTV